MPFPIDLKYIIETEEKLGVTFPNDYKEKMLKENGGVIYTDEHDWILHPFFDKLDNKRISRTSNDIILETNEAKKWSNYPISAIAIASNGFGDLLILLPTNQNEKILKQEVFVWLHENGAIIEIANSFKELS
jgi:hypothetical protein